MTKTKMIDDLDGQLAEVSARNEARAAAERQAEADRETERRLRAERSAREQAKTREAGLARIATMLKAHADGNGRLATEIEDFYAQTLKGVSGPAQTWTGVAAIFASIEGELARIGCPLREHSQEARKAFESIAGELEQRGVDCWALHQARNNLSEAPFRGMPNLSERPHGIAVGELLRWEIHRRAVERAEP